jgi:uncharacterized protein
MRGAVAAGAVLRAVLAWGGRAVWLGGCGAAKAPARVPLHCGGATVWVEVADDPAEREHGLMMRRAMEEDHGMLFVFERPSPQSFWMHNTLIPLSIAYIGDGGEVLEIHDMFPLDRSPVPSASPLVRYALEVNSGWFQRHGVKPGQRFDVAKALVAAPR